MPLVVTCIISGSPHRLEVNPVDVTPTPVLPGFKRLDDWMCRGVKMPGRMLVLGRIAAADMAADQAFTQMYPGVTHPQALLTAVRARSDLPNLIEVGAGRGHAYSPSHKCLHAAMMKLL